MSRTDYTPAQRKHIARAFRAAKEHLKDGTGAGKTQFICYAVNRAYSAWLDRLIAEFEGAAS